MSAETPGNRSDFPPIVPFPNPTEEDLAARYAGPNPIRARQAELPPPADQAQARRREAIAAGWDWHRDRYVHNKRESA